jgi:PhnB protein
MYIMVNWKPDSWKGTMAPFLVVKDAAKAIEFYKAAFGAKEEDRSEGPGGKIMHAEIRIGDNVIMLSDEFAEMKCMSAETLNGSPVTIFIYVQDVDKVYEQATKAGAKAERAPEDMFWGDRFCGMVDPFGHKWSFATHKEDLTHEQVAARQKEWMAKQMAGAKK